MRLSQRQALFASNIAKLILWANEQPGFYVTLGEAWRPPETAALYAQRGLGIERSLHQDRLACDLNLYIDGDYQTLTSAYKPLGEHWKSLHPQHAWGGDFKRADGNHFSFRYDGRA